MDYRVSFEQKIQAVDMSGSFTYQDHARFCELMVLLWLPGVERVTLNFSHITFIDSAALGMLLLLKDEADKRNITVALYAAQGQVARVFELSRFDDLFECGDGL